MESRFARKRGKVKQKHKFLNIGKHETPFGFRKWVIGICVAVFGIFMPLRGYGEQHFTFSPERFLQN